MRYICLIYQDESLFAGMSPREHEALTGACMDYDSALEASGHLVLAHALKPSGTARTVRVKARRKRVTDGPFAETKEQLIGLVLIDARSEDEALDIAAQSPLAAMGAIEVRGAFDIRDAT